MVVAVPEMPLPDSFLAALLADLDDANTVAIALFGSHARGDPTPPYSDVDMARFVRVLPARDSERYTLRCRADHLVSISTTTIGLKRAEMNEPDEAIWVVPALRQMRILLDKDGALAALQQEAVAFRWEPLQGAADAYASEEVFGFAEEAHKVLGGLLKGDESMVLYATWGLVLGLTRALLVQRGVLVESDNTYFRQAQQTAGLDSAWTRALRLAAGFDAPAPDVPPFVARGVAGLRLYVETARLLRGILAPAHRAVIERTLAAIRESGFLPDGP